MLKTLNMDQDNDNGLELSLGLGFFGGQSSTKSKTKNRACLNAPLFNNQRSTVGGTSQYYMSNSTKQRENFFLSLSSRNDDDDGEAASVTLGATDLRVGSSNRCENFEENGQTEQINKRKLEHDDDNTGARKKPAIGLSLDLLAIKPGISSNVRFGGSGSYPNLPWVSTTAPGPSGRTISGVIYSYGTTEIRIVCACHSWHMSPEGFIHHARESNNDGSART